ncbi:beta-lactamase/transpeptidase-like protein [Aspergillus navahoensis]
MPFTEQTVSTLRSIELFAHTAGKRGAESSEAMTLDTIFWIASCTRCLSVLHACRSPKRSILDLDDEDQIESLCPELRDLKVLKEDGTLEDKKNAITLRMLMTHTVDFGYRFFNNRLREWSYPAGVDGFSGRIEDARMPLLFQPGEGWYEPEVKRVFDSGGAGMFAKLQEYCRILSVLFNNGTCPTAGVRLLLPSTVETMYSNQIPHMPNYSRQSIPASRPDLINPFTELYPVPGNPPQGWGLTSTATAHWAGLTNQGWWADREKEVSGMVCSQLLPFVDLNVYKALDGTT